MHDADEVSWGIFALPTEILLQVFRLFSTKSLLSISSTCRSFHSLVVRIIQQRLQVAAGLDGHTLYLECSTPAEKSTTSKVFCLPLGTDNLPELISEIRVDGGRIGHIDRFNKLYTRFRPVNHEPDFKSVPRPHPAGDIPGSRTYLSSEEAAIAWKKYTEQAVTRAVHLDASFLFSQLETAAFLGRREAFRGLLFSIQEVGEGTIRVWRDWLAKQCQARRFTDGELIAIRRDESSEATDLRKSRSDSTSSLVDVKRNPAILWLNTTDEVIGIKFQVLEQMWRREQSVTSMDETGPPVSYKVELQEVLIRSTHLLLKLEESKNQDHNQSSQAMTFLGYVE